MQQDNNDCIQEPKRNQDSILLARSSDPGTDNMSLEFLGTGSGPGIEVSQFLSLVDELEHVAIRWHRSIAHS